MSELELSFTEEIDLFGEELENKEVTFSVYKVIEFYNTSGDIIFSLFKNEKNQTHRDFENPARETINTKQYFKEGKLHRENGAAVIDKHCITNNKYYLEGKYYTESEFYKEVRRRKDLQFALETLANTNQESFEVNGKKYKLTEVTEESKNGKKEE